jgi:hypothetical protein
MEETQLNTLEALQKISPPQFNLRISNSGEIDLQGNIKGEDLQSILDSSHLRNKLYLEHQKHLDRDSNLMAIYIGLVFSTLVGLTCFCLFNQSPKSQNYQSLGVINHVHNG